MQSVQFTAFVQGAANQNVDWSISPNVGSIVNGMYSAPASVNADSVITISAMSSVDPSQTATATVLLASTISTGYPTVPAPVSNVIVALAPGFATVAGGQSLHFTAMVSGTTDTAVTWQLIPNVGIVVAGLYIAPASVSSAQEIKIIATSVADSTKTATGTITLPQVVITLSPGVTSLTGGQGATFTASVSGAGNTGVTWSIKPQIGSIVNGVYQAPAVIASAQAVTISATSVADSSKTATATVSLVPITVTEAPSSVSLGVGQSATFTASVRGTSNAGVSWSLIPQVGTVVNGVYTAPTSIANSQTVTLTATSVVDSSKSATAAITLNATRINVSPTAASLTGGQSATFTANVSGTSSTGVVWSLNPQVGTINNGFYQAPSVIGSSQTVTITATSVADSSKYATTSVTLTAAGISLSPASASLTGGQSATFAATLNGTNNTAVTWSINPQVGTIAGGVYQAPAVITTAQAVTIRGTSAADPSKSATATVSLAPVAITLGPASVSLGVGQSATFTAHDSGTSNSAITWSLNPQVGTVVNGVYTAPTSIANSQTVTLTVASAVDSTRSATASITLTAPAPPPPTTITLPLEVIGPDGTTLSTSVSIPSGANLNGQLALWMQIHGLRTESQGSVQVNNSGWLPISTGSITLLGNAAAYGGIGGGFSTLKMTMNLPAGSIQTGANTVTFRFNQTDGRVSGYRVLAFNIQAADGSSLIPASAFVYDDPSNWQPPSTSTSDIAAGQTLWHGAALTTPIAGGAKPILAHCSDCHAQDGRDLKYFNYSNHSIRARSLFHGLTAQQGDQIASYIRSLNVVNPGRPWNPPYQPGPGLDSQPVIDWAAGAGLDAVLDSDQDMINAMFPSGFQDSVFAATSRLNQRETPIALQLPDWNQWLPGTHPMDAFGSDFTSSAYNTGYQTLRSNLGVLNSAGYAAEKPNFDLWFNGYYNLYELTGTPVWSNPALWTPAKVDAIYSLPQWGMVKSWELMNEFQLEGFSQNIFGPQADTRAWYNPLPFDVSPHHLKMPRTGAAGLRNGSQDDYIYLSYIWYHLQLILYDSNGQQRDHQPIDWGYSNDLLQNLGTLHSPQGGIQTLWLIKGLQISQEVGTGPELGIEGWQPFGVNQIGLLVTQPWDAAVWTGVDSNTRAGLAQGMLKAWLAQVNQFTPQQFYAGRWTTATTVPVPGGNAEGSFADWVWYSIPRFKFLGVDPTLIGQWAQWAQTMWPNANWNVALAATCTPPNNGTISCSQ